MKKGIRGKVRFSSLHWITNVCEQPKLINVHVFINVRYRFCPTVIYSVLKLFIGLTIAAFIDS